MPDEKGQPKKWTSASVESSGASLTNDFLPRREQESLRFAAQVFRLADPTKKVVAREKKRVRERERERTAVVSPFHV
jgi:hypothetical protein